MPTEQTLCSWCHQPVTERGRQTHDVCYPNPDRDRSGEGDAEAERRELERLREGRVL